MKFNKNDLSYKIKVIEDEKLKAIITIQFEWGSIKGFRIMPSSFMGDHGENLWIVPPTYKTPYGYKPIAYFEKSLWKAIEVDIIREYKKALEMHITKKMGGVKVKETKQDNEDDGWSQADPDSYS